MIVTGKKIFNPVSITFETEEELLMFWEGIEDIIENLNLNQKVVSRFHQQLIDISNQLSML